MKPTLYLLSVLLFSISAQSQDTLSISGGDASGGGGTSSYTLSSPISLYALYESFK
jgi:hypothetical protein